MAEEGTLRPRLLRRPPLLSRSRPELCAEPAIRALLRERPSQCRGSDTTLRASSAFSVTSPLRDPFSSETCRDLESPLFCSQSFNPFFSSSVKQGFCCDACEKTLPPEIEGGAVPCAKCNKILVGSVIQALGKEYHKGKEQQKQMCFARFNSSLSTQSALAVQCVTSRSAAAASLPLMEDPFARRTQTTKSLVQGSFTPCWQSTRPVQRWKVLFGPQSRVLEAAWACLPDSRPAERCRQ